MEKITFQTSNSRTRFSTFVNAVHNRCSTPSFCGRQRDRYENRRVERIEYNVDKIQSIDRRWKKEFFSNVIPIVRSCVPMFGRENGMAIRLPLVW